MTAHIPVHFLMLRGQGPPDVVAYAMAEAWAHRHARCAWFRTQQSDRPQSS